MRVVIEGVRDGGIQLLELFLVGHESIESFFKLLFADCLETNCDLLLLLTLLFRDYLHKHLLNRVVQRGIRGIRCFLELSWLGWGYGVVESGRRRGYPGIRCFRVDFVHLIRKGDKDHLFLWLLRTTFVSNRLNLNCEWRTDCT